MSEWVLYLLLSHVYTQRGTHYPHFIYEILFIYLFHSLLFRWKIIRSFCHFSFESFFYFHFFAHTNCYCYYAITRYTRWCCMLCAVRAYFITPFLCSFANIFSFCFVNHLYIRMLLKCCVCKFKSFVFCILIFWKKKKKFNIIHLNLVRVYVCLLIWVFFSLFDSASWIKI